MPIQKVKKLELERIEACLYASDMGPQIVQWLLTEHLQKSDSLTFAQIKEQLFQGILKITQQGVSPQPLYTKDTKVTPTIQKPTTIWMIVGVNGAGKTTTIAKLAFQWLQRKQRVCIGAGDTFRAAAQQQLKFPGPKEWKHRNHKMEWAPW